MIKFIHKWLLKLHKRKVLLEVQTDIKYLLEFKNDHIFFDETDARLQLANLKRSEVDDTEKQSRIAKIEEDINMHNAVVAEYERSLKLESELKDYLSII